MGQSSFDDILVRNREDVEVRTRDRLQSLMDAYNSGIAVISVQLQDVQAPDEVRGAFNDVSRARQNKEFMIKRAYEFEDKVISQARVEAEKIINVAEASGPARIIHAEEEAGRFASILLEYHKEKDMARRQLYLESMEEMLPGVTQFITSLESNP